MFRSILGFAVFAVIAFVALKVVFVVFALSFGIAVTLLWWAAMGFIIYLVIRLVSPNTAARIREAIRGRPAGA